MMHGGWVILFYYPILSRRYMLIDPLGTALQAHSALPFCNREIFTTLSITDAIEMLRANVN